MCEFKPYTINKVQPSRVCSRGKVSFCFVWLIYHLRLNHLPIAIWPLGIIESDKSLWLLTRIKSKLLFILTDMPLFLYVYLKSLMKLLGIEKNCNLNKFILEWFMTESSWLNNIIHFKILLCGCERVTFLYSLPLHCPCTDSMHFFSICNNNAANAIVMSQGLKTVRTV